MPARRVRCLDVEACYVAWSDAERSDRGAAFAAYHAALDREQSAARTHERSIARLRAQCATTSGLVGWSWRRRSRSCPRWSASW
jgi:hypothetical protein